MQVDFYETQRGRCPFIEFIDALPSKAQAKCLKYVEVLEEKGFTLPTSYIKKISGTDKIWELRPEFGGTEYRLLFFEISEEKVIIVHGIIKKDKKLRQKDIRVAEARIKDFIERESENL
ncbi:MAG TPA: type II toxin-antitoxin system RelE/ParE family toxin [Pedobacter sp.]